LSPPGPRAARRGDLTSKCPSSPGHTRTCPELRLAALPLPSARAQHAFHSPAPLPVQNRAGAQVQSEACHPHQLQQVHHRLCAQPQRCSAAQGMQEGGWLQHCRRRQELRAPRDLISMSRQCVSAAVRARQGGERAWACRLQAHAKRLLRWHGVRMRAGGWRQARAQAPSRGCATAWRSVSAAPARTCWAARAGPGAGRCPCARSP